METSQLLDNDVVVHQYGSTISANIMYLDTTKDIWEVILD